jgi:fucose 4-O-acetylase-like acetyltransferase
MMQVSQSGKAQTLAPPSDRARKVWIDFARGIGVILVVYGHVLGGLVRADLFPQGALASWMDYTLYTFHMPLFFFLAGLNVQHSLRRGPKPFLFSKGWTIAYPYVLWSLVQGGIIMLMICHVLAVLLPNRTAMIAVAAIGLAAFMLLPVRPDLSLTLHHLPFYVVGLYATRSVMAWQPRGGTGWTTLMLIALAFAAAVALGGNISGMDALGLASLPACVLGIAGVVVVCKLLAEARHRWLAAVGLMSMTIYVLHILAGSGIRIVMLKLHVPPLPWVYLLAGTAAGVMLPMLAHAVLQRLNLLAPLGLAPLPSRQPASAVPFGKVAASD